MESDDLKKITDAMNSAGFDVKKIEMEKKVLDTEAYTGALLVRIVRHEKENGI
jgi:hypothetical protein